MRKVVVSRRPQEFAWRNSEVIDGDLVEAVTALKADAGIKGILIPGSISVVQQLLAESLLIAIAGGLIGMGVDAATGAALDHKPNPVIVTMVPIAPAASAPVRSPKPAHRAPEAGT